MEAAFVGAYTIIEAGAKVGKGVTVGERSKICAGVEIGHGQTVGNDTVVYGSAWGDRRQEKRGLGLDEARTEWVDAQGLALRRLWTGK